MMANLPGSVPFFENIIAFLFKVYFTHIKTLENLFGPV